MMETNRLKAKTKFSFGICDLGGNLFFTLMGFWSLKYLTDIAGLAAALAGIAVMAGKVWDAVTDPMMGYISDRTLSRWGRRRPYLLFGSIPLMLSMWLFFSAPNAASPVMLAVWACFALMLLNTAMTVINIPYNSLTPELTDDYHERSSLNGYRFGCAVFGTILGAALVLPLVNIFAGFKQNDSDSLKFGWSMTGLLMGAVVAITTLFTFFGVREKPHAKADLPVKSFFATYKSVFQNGPYVKLLLTYGLNIMGLNFLQTILAYYTEYVYLRPDITPVAMIILLLTAMVCIPLSVLVSKKTGKKLAYQITFAVLASACLVIFFLGGKLGPNFFLGMMVYAGIGLGFGYVAPFAMVPDAVDYGAARYGEGDEGAYYGIWTFVSKLGISFSVFVSGLILSAGGYIANVAQSASAITAIKLIIGPIPALILLGAMLLIETYPLDEKAVNELKDARK
ncbi:MAG: glycoside-pentoside-hexuronide (GPH):cation symporter [Treponema sp.]|nr:glycoside-pentoside-hexuronide (GPH):cation symporter [Treponema sp.]